MSRLQPLRRWRDARRLRACLDQPPHVLIIVHNLPVPFDRRVWLQCQALRDAGFRVSVICPCGPGDPPFEVHEGVALHKYTPKESSGGALSYVIEFLVGWIASARLAVRVWRHDRIDVIQACNPPDIYFSLAAPFKLGGTSFVFDQHDLAPELYEARYGNRHPLVRRALTLLERWSHGSADHVIVPNESYRQLALQRGGVAASDVTVVRNGPDLKALTVQEPDPELRYGKQHLCCYLGVMGAQDGVDLLVQAIELVVHEHGVQNCHFALLGYGERKDVVERWVTDHGLADWVTFTGRVDDQQISAYLSTASLGLAPEPPNEFNNRSTIVKVMEYMAFRLPVVAFDLAETVVSAGEGAVYVHGDDVKSFAQAIVDLLAAPAERNRRGQIARERVEEHLSWQHQRQHYLAVMERHVAERRPHGAPQSGVGSEPSQKGPVALSSRAPKEGSRS